MAPAGGGLRVLHISSYLSRSLCDLSLETSLGSLAGGGLTFEPHSLLRINIFSPTLLPLVTGVGGPASEGFPEVERFLTLKHCFLVIPWEDSGHRPRHLTLVPMTALASRS